MISTIARALVLVAALSKPAPAPAAGADSAHAENPESLRHYVAGRMLEEQGDSDGAFREYYQALSSDPHAAGVARRISELAARNGDLQRSLDFANRALALDSTDARAHWLKGAAQFQLGQVSEAMSSLVAATVADSERAEYFETLAHVAEEANLPDQQERALKRLVDAARRRFRGLVPARGAGRASRPVRAGRERASGSGRSQPRSARHGLPARMDQRRPGPRLARDRELSTAPGGARLGPDDPPPPGHAAGTPAAFRGGLPRIEAA